jgi:DNA polymerase-4
VVQQESLVPDLEFVAEEMSDTGLPPTVSEAADTAPAWRIGDDVVHTALGHGWVQGAGHGVMTVRFETRSTGRGPAHTMRSDDAEVSRANPVDSLDWPDYVDLISRYQNAP